LTEVYDKLSLFIQTVTISRRKAVVQMRTIKRTTNTKLAKKLRSFNRSKVCNFFRFYTQWCFRLFRPEVNKKENK